LPICPNEEKRKRRKKERMFRRKMSGVARWFISKPKIPLLGKFWRALD
jgi:hypothetical protein